MPTCRSLSAPCLLLLAALLPYQAYAGCGASYCPLNTRYLSPGFSYAVSDKTQLYLFAQQAVYHRVNGVQLVTEQAFAGGLSMRF